MNPDLINYEIQDVPQQSDIRTEESEPLNPATNNTRVFRFKINNTGFLDGTSMITFKLQKGATATGLTRVNLWNGALGAIKSAVLRVGDYEICNTQDLSRIASVRHLNEDVSVRNNMHGYYLGNALGVMVDSSAGSTDNDGAGAGVGQVRNDVYASGIDWGHITDGTNHQVFSYSMNTDLKKCEKYGIPLYMLFPCLENRQFPLFLFQDYPVILEVEFREASEYVNDMGKVGADGYVAVDNSVNIAEVKLVVDYILPPASVMNKYEDDVSKTGYRFEYPKINLVKKSIPAVTTNREEQEVEHRLGQEGKEILKVFQFKKYTKGTDPLAGAVMGNKVLLDQKIDGQDYEEYNMEVNGQDIFPDFKYNNASQFNEVANALDKPLKVPRCMYFTDPNTQQARLTQISSGLKGVQKPLAIDLRNGNAGIIGSGTPVSKGSPLVFKYRRKPSGAVTDQIVNQKPAMDVSYHIVQSGVAVIKKSGAGTSVLVQA
tara:strand:- start:5093 stop:6556 length:1464 start_codon:yes stop_codon:yes gene_type:complete